MAKADIQNKDRGNRMRDLILTVKDGGPSDADNAADGHITLVGGPKDSFWGYAFGTLFIRFFGIFLVLSILMAGMQFSGRIFEKMDIRKSQNGMRSESESAEPASIPQAVGSDDGEQAVDTESVAAAAAALHIHLSRTRAPERLELRTTESTGWIQHGRQMAMEAYPLSARRYR